MAQNLHHYLEWALFQRAARLEKTEGLLGWAARQGKPLVGLTAQMYDLWTADVRALNSYITVVRMELDQHGTTRPFRLDPPLLRGDLRLHWFADFDDPVVHKPQAPTLPQPVVKRRKPRAKTPAPISPQTLPTDREPSQRVRVRGYLAEEECWRTDFSNDVPYSLGTVDTFYETETALYRRGASHNKPWQLRHARWPDYHRPRRR